MKLTSLAAALAVVGAQLAAAPAASADCVTSGGTTVCSQGDVRGSGASKGPGQSGPYYPYPCEYDWYCRSGNGSIGDVFGSGGQPGWQPRYGKRF